MTDYDAMGTLEGDPAIDMLKTLFAAEVEKVKEKVIEDSRKLIACEHEKNKCKIERIMMSFKEKFDSLKQEVLTDMEEKMKSFKIDLKKELDLNQNKKKKKKVNDLDDTDSKDDDEGEDEDLSDFEVRLWGKSYGTKRSTQKKKADDDDDDYDDDDEEHEAPVPKKRGRKKGSKNKTPSKAQLEAALTKLQQKSGKKK